MAAIFPKFMSWGKGKQVPGFGPLLGDGLWGVDEYKRTCSPKDLWILRRKKIWIQVVRVAGLSY